MAAVLAGAEAPAGTEDAPDAAEIEQIGMPEAHITHAVDVRAVLDRKRAAMACHESQIGPESWLLQMDDDMFAVAFGTEWFIDPTRPRADGDPFASELLTLDPHGS
jgi:LmbE family N-acetylglucosaminyl deacetylase